MLGSKQPVRCAPCRVEARSRGNYSLSCAAGTARVEQQSIRRLCRTHEDSSTTENPASDVVDSRAEPLGLSPPTNSTIDRLSSGLCRGGLVLFVVSLLLPALYVRPTPGVGWGGTFPGYVCLGVSFVSFPCSVPNVLTIAAPFICTFAGKKAKKAAGVVLALTALSVLQPERTRTAAPDRSHFFLVTTGAASTIAVPIRRASQAQRFCMAIEGSADPNIARESEPSCAKRVRNVYLIGPPGNGCCPNACPFQSNPLRAGLVRRPEQWDRSSHWTPPIVLRWSFAVDPSGRQPKKTRSARRTFVVVGSRSVNKRRFLYRYQE
jgi:hypothetical protein